MFAHFDFKLFIRVEDGNFRDIRNLAVSTAYSFADSKLVGIVADIVVAVVEPKKETLNAVDLGVFTSGRYTLFYFLKKSIAEKFLNYKILMERTRIRCEIKK